MHLGANPPCTSVTDTMKLCISRVPVAYAGADAMICEGFTYTISDATASHYTGLTWTTSGTGTFSDIHAVNPVYTPSNADILAGSVTLTMNLTACSPCPNVSDSMILTIHRNPTATAYVISNVSCFGLSDGVVSVSVTGGTSPYSYLWSTTATTQTVSGLSIGTYYVTVTDNFGCRNHSQTTVGQPPLLTVSGTVNQNVRCKGGSEGQITITPDGGTPGYSYLWSNNATTQNISGLTAGTYSVTVTDSHTCIATGSWTVTEPDLLTVGGDVTHNVVCKGGSEGSITITAGGGTVSYSYLWSNNATSRDISGLTAGTYTVTVTDSHTCTVTGSWTVTEPDLLTVDGMVTHHVLCHGGNDGTISITAGGGTEAYSYMWSNSATTPNISALTAGTYTVTVTDAHSCTASGSWTVTQPEALSISGIVTNVYCYSYSTGAIDVTYGGGVTPYHYIWSNSATSGSLSGLISGTYTVTVTDAHSCTLSNSWTVTQPPVWKVLITGPDAACCNSATTASYHASTTGAVPQCSNNQDPTFQWIVTGGTITSGWNTQTITVNWSCCGTGIVSVAATACNGCIRDTSASIAIHPQPAPVISGPVTVPSDTTAVYCTPNFNGHLYTWTIFGGTIVAGNNTNCISIQWGPYPPCGCGSVTVCETDPTTQCTGCTTMNITILPAHPNLDGYVYYQNGYNTGLNGVVVQLKNLATGITVATDTTGPNLHSSNAPGYFAFTGLDEGTYRLEASYDGTWGGNNATDALLVQLDVIGSVTLTGLPLAVADVNASNTITGLDALYIKLRTVGMIDSYPAGNWMFDNPTVTVTSTPLSQNIMGLCVGDVNGSYIPNGMKDASSLSIIDDGIQTIPFLDSFTYTIRSSQAAELGAMTLFMGYDQNLFRIDKVNTSLDGMKYVIGEGKIALAWSDTKSLQVKYADPILSLTLSSRVAVPEATRIFSIMPGSEFADIKASKLDNFDLRMAEVVNPHSSFSMFTYPNPFNDFANIVYTLPESGHVKLIITDMFGKIIRSFVDANQDAGIYQVTVHPGELNMTPGMYFCKIEVAGKTDTFKKVDKLIFQH
jgi:predicted small secreted protein